MKTPPMRGFEHSLPMLLMRAREAVMNNFMPFLREHNLSPQQWRVLRALMEHREMDATELAEICHLLLPSLSRILRNMEVRELILRKSDAHDQRRTLISITSSGQRLFTQLAPFSETRYDEIEQVLGSEKVEQLYQLLQETVDKLGKKDAKS